MRDPTPQEVKLFWTYMLARFNAQVVPKEDDWRMEAAAWFLDEMGITDKQAFMEQFTTTIFDTIYIPFTIGVASPGYDLWDQVTVCIHECEHVCQCSLDGRATFATKYLAHKSDRSHYEAEAFRADLEADFWRYGDVSDPGARANVLQYYGVDQEDIEYVRKYLVSSMETIRAGGVVSKSAQAAMVWLGKNAQEWRSI